VDGLVVVEEILDDHFVAVEQLEFAVYGREVFELFLQAGILDLFSCALT
jgi:hypothetical protein